MATNTTTSVFKDSKKSEATLATEAMKEGQNLTKKERVKFKCSAIYGALYPNGFESTCQGIHIYLIFDDREVELPKFIADYVMYKLNKKAHAEINKKLRNDTQKQDYLGMHYVN